MVTLVLTEEIGFGWLRGASLQRGEPVRKGRVKIVSQVNSKHDHSDPSSGSIDGHVDGEVSEGDYF